MYICSPLDTSAAITILSVLTTRRGSQVVRSRSAKPLFAGSIPAPALRCRSGSLDTRVFISRAGSIDSLSPDSSPYRASSMSLGRRPAPFPPPPLFIGKSGCKLVKKCPSENKSIDLRPCPSMSVKADFACSVIVESRRATPRARQNSSCIALGGSSAGGQFSPWRSPRS
jgi:hypothetical protein